MQSEVWPPGPSTSLVPESHLHHPPGGGIPTVVVEEYQHEEEVETNGFVLTQDEHVEEDALEESDFDRRLAEPPGPRASSTGRNGYYVLSQLNPHDGAFHTGFV